MLTSDGISRAHFLVLWRDAMAEAHLDERARLLLEVGRATLREEGRVTPVLVVVRDDEDEPYVWLPMPDLPRRGERAWDTLQQRLIGLRAVQVLALVALNTSQGGGAAHFLLAAWGESLSGQESCVVMPYRHATEGLEEAEPLRVPDPKVTVFSQLMSGVLATRH